MPIMVLIFSLVLFSAPAWAQSPLATAAKALAVGSWVELTTTNMILLNDAAGGGQGHHIPYAEGMALDPVTGSIYYLGSDDPLNDPDPIFVRFRESTNAWESVAAGSPYSGPSHLHQYDGAAMDFVNRKFYFLHGGGGDPLDEYDLTTGTWGTRGAAPGGSYVCCEGLVYFPERTSLYHTRSGVLLRLQDGSSTWAEVSSGYGTNYHAFMLYNPVHQIMLFGGGNGVVDVYKMNAAGTVTQIADAPFDMRTPSIEATYDPVSGDVLVLESYSQSWYKYVVGTDTWTQLSNTGVPAGIWNAADAFNALATPIPAYGVVMFSNCPEGGAACHVYLYKHSATPIFNGTGMPSLQDEKDTYTAMGWTWTAGDLPNAAADPTYAVNDPDMHGDMEGDDLWTNLMMWRRTGQQGYLDRASAWMDYFKNRYRQCVGSSTFTYCYDRDSFGLDHVSGLGLIAWYEHTLDRTALAAAEAIGGDIETLNSTGSSYGCLLTNACMHFGPRQSARMLMIIHRLFEVTQDARWSTLRDTILGRIMGASEWNAAEGMYFVGQENTDTVAGAGAYAAGYRVQSAFQITILANALFHVWKATGDAAIRTRLLAMANFVDARGLDATYDYTGSWFGIDPSNVTWHNYGASPPATFWDPVYTTDLVNTLVIGYKLGGGAGLLTSARYFLNRGTKGEYGSATNRLAPDNEVHHFIDSVFDSATSGFYFAYNKGELQYTYLLFENGGSPTLEVAGDTLAPSPPTNLLVTSP